MIEVKIDIKDMITGDIDKIKQELRDIPNKAIVEYRNLTPVDKGNARRNTVLRGNTIQANYPYAQVLDEGRSVRDGQMRGSTQAPKGMTAPWSEWLKKYVDNLMKR
jgi:hypothetical protein